MKAEFTGGRVKWTIESTDGNISSSDFVTVVQNCTMSPAGFDELFFRFVNDSKTHVEAYERAEKVHETLLGKRRYSDYTSFAESKRVRLKK
jgi:hypothetical protein